MRNKLKRQPAGPRGDRLRARNEELETALLAEFTRHDSVASLAVAIAGRLGGVAREEDLIAGAGLGRLRVRG